MANGIKKPTYMCLCQKVLDRDNAFKFIEVQKRLIYTSYMLTDQIAAKTNHACS